MIINVLYNWSYIYFSYNNNIKYIDSIIKYIDFKSINYIINLNIISSFYYNVNG